MWLKRGSAADLQRKVGAMRDGEARQHWNLTLYYWPMVALAVLGWHQWQLTCKNRTTCCLAGTKGLHLQRPCHLEADHAVATCSTTANNTS